MYRQTIVWPAPLAGVRARGHTQAGTRRGESSARAATGPVAASFPTESARPAAPAADLRPLLESLGAALEEIERRRQQSLGEMQQVALELAVAVTSHLVFEAISRENYAVEQLVGKALEQVGLDSVPIVALHPADLDLLHKRLAGKPAPWPEGAITLRADPGVARGGCRVEAPDGRMLVSDIASRLSEIRRHWMEELDDAQIERRRSQAEGQSLRRFPDRRETA